MNNENHFYFKGMHQPQLHQTASFPGLGLSVPMERQDMGVMLELHARRLQRDILVFRERAMDALQASTTAAFRSQQLFQQRALTLQNEWASMFDDMKGDWATIKDEEMTRIRVRSLQLQKWLEHAAECELQQATSLKQQAAMDAVSALSYRVREDALRAANEAFARKCEVSRQRAAADKQRREAAWSDIADAIQDLRTRAELLAEREAHCAAREAALHGASTVVVGCPSVPMTSPSQLEGGESTRQAGDKHIDSTNNTGEGGEREVLPLSFVHHRSRFAECRVSVHGAADTASRYHGVEPAVSLHQPFTVSIALEWSEMKRWWLENNGNDLLEQRRLNTMKPLVCVGSLVLPHASYVAVNAPQVVEGACLPASIAFEPQLPSNRNTDDDGNIVMRGVGTFEIRRCNRSTVVVDDDSLCFATVLIWPPVPHASPILLSIPMRIRGGAPRDEPLDDAQGDRLTEVETVNMDDGNKQHSEVVKEQTKEGQEGTSMGVDASLSLIAAEPDGAAATAADAGTSFDKSTRRSQWQLVHNAPHHEWWARNADTGCVFTQSGSPGSPPEELPSEGHDDAMPTSSGWHRVNEMGLVRGPAFTLWCPQDADMVFAVYPTPQADRVSSEENRGDASLLREGGTSLSLFAVDLLSTVATVPLPLRQQPHPSTPLPSQQSGVEDVAEAVSSLVPAADHRCVFGCTHSCVFVLESEWSSEPTCRVIATVTDLAPPVADNGHHSDDDVVPHVDRIDTSERGLVAVLSDGRAVPLDDLLTE